MSTPPTKKNPVEEETESGVVTTATSSSSNKRQKTDGGEGAAVTPTSTSSGTVGDDDDDERPLDLATLYGYKAGDRLEVQWELEIDDEEEAESQETKTVIRWWKATLLEHDGRTVDNVAIRVLKYEALPEFGFDTSQEDVVFLGRNTLVAPPPNDNKVEVNLQDLTQLTYRREGSVVVNDNGDNGALERAGLDSVATAASKNDNQVSIPNSEEAFDEQLNQILMASLEKLQHKYNALPASAQALVGTKIQEQKEKLKKALMEKSKSQDVFTADTIKEILASVS